MAGTVEGCGGEWIGLPVRAVPLPTEEAVRGRAHELGRDPMFMLDLVLALHLPAAPEWWAMGQFEGFLRCAGGVHPSSLS